jgi:hypothetical protein
VKTHWETIRGSQVFYIDVYETTVMVGDHRGSGHTDNSGSVSFDRFLTGEYQNLIERTHGKAILDEVIAAVNAKRG